MDEKTFIVEMSKPGVDLVRVAAWPALFGLIVIIFQDQVAGLISRIKEAALGKDGASVSFSDKVLEVKAEVEKLAEEEKAPAKDPLADTHESFQLAERDPRAAIKQKWEQVSGSLQAAIRRAVPQRPLAMDDLSFVKHFELGEMVPAGTTAVYDKLLKLRIQVENPQIEISVAAARGFVSSGAYLELCFHQVAKNI